MRKLKVQAVVCLIILLIVQLLAYVDNDSTTRILDSSERIMRNELTPDEIKTCSNRIVQTFTHIPQTVAVLNERIINDMTYGDPIDEVYEGERTIVYAVAGGTVRELGNNDDIGKYIIIQHGNTSESIYGNLSSINCSLNERVKKGEIIGEYEFSDEKNFYYALNYFDKAY